MKRLGWRLNHGIGALVAAICVSAGCDDAEELPDLSGLADTCSTELARAGEICVPPGQRELGSDAGGWAVEADEAPRMNQVLPYALLVHRTATTVRTWNAVMPELSRSVDALENPVVDVTWWQALAYANRRSGQEGLPECYRLEGCDERWSRCSRVVVAGPYCTGFRLPSELEWEHAGRYALGDRHSPVGSAPIVAECRAQDWLNGVHYCATSGGDLAPADAAGELPLEHILGNVWEWTEDAYHPVRPEVHAVERAIVLPSQFVSRRGCSYRSTADQCRLSNRNFLPAAPGDQATGFRLVRSHQRP